MVTVGQLLHTTHRPIVSLALIVKRVFCIFFTVVSFTVFSSSLLKACARKKNRREMNRKLHVALLALSLFSSPVDLSLQERPFFCFPAVPPLFQPQEVEMQTI
ncbi:hypothetical protein ABB37_06762 [Leptomonas pyrrhocoris]|uniref:Uncharacterized protein n=1 Tax=Leptomonas pyrrhocoris TaxID=157538 RepID=A0A0N0VEC5_LEPPY|nr:hypothetical protein ABB37_06762 [Leptomonas pyrrhocoris]KPA78001.1 hypothetical protein ABB37_06762 [Leptomonas pyrrhocoris]|eukprot:XP_015656440.1 hypothetical protein ABB37_06762 [Leptomonas pyrrhocoris]